MRTRISQFAIFVSLVTIFFAAGSFVHAQTNQTIDELQQKISSNTDKVQKLIPEIKQLEKDLINTGTQKKTLGTEIKTLDLTKKKLEIDIKITQTKVDTTDLKIRQLGSEILYKEDELSARLAALKEVLLAIYESDEQSLAQIALSNESFSDLWNDLETLEQFSDGVNENVKLIKSFKKDLEEKNKKQKTEKGKLLGLKGELGDQKKITEDNKKQKAELLKKTNNQESQYQKALKQKLALKVALEQELRDYESTLKFILDPTSFPQRGTKVFASPLDNIRITQQFGKTTSSARLYASGTHNGTDFGVSVGTPVKAMLSGTIIGAGDTDLTCPGASYGRWVLIRHKNGLASLYAHLSLLKASEGQVVETGDVIGYSGNTGYSTGPHLHLTVFAASGVKVESRASKSCGGRVYTIPLAALNAYLDPMDYL
ncbi:MAG: peptidoglycan DD-metalloendopeptidase family protein [Patescibacteria group bacterium]